VTGLLLDPLEGFSVALQLIMLLLEVLLLLLLF